ncbi:S-adenosyl-L-methionine-dependent methyltransferase [Saccharata proteae CBS 121410]|uniref:S-adenosyl-L-methionine-dependent methyltransferase n=1 Tax=Saccharata proteae CBS 121410 TaxID=1314787 RepID=A0A6A5YDR4_9PEZI|nr:S-adenosyl-L-methionine-dependent methyltransferase [Saccharata proteae CBS 121410]
MVLDWQNADVAVNYRQNESLMGPFATALVRQAGLYQEESNKHAELAILDNACGTGVVSAVLQENLPVAVKGRLQLTCGDISEPMIKFVKERIDADKWKNAEAKIVDAQSMPLPSAHYTHTFTNFGIMLLPRPFTALSEIRRVLRPNGVCSFTSWNSVGWYPAVYAAALRLPSYSPLPTWPEFLNGVGEEGASQWHDKDWIRQTVEEQGFVVEACEVVKQITTQKDSDDFIKTFEGMVRVTVKRAWGAVNEEQKVRLLKDKIQDVLQEWYGNGKCSLDWVAIIVKARKAVNQVS